MKKEAKEDHINIKVKDMVRGFREMTCERETEVVELGRRAIDRADSRRGMNARSRDECSTRAG